MYKVIFTLALIQCSLNIFAQTFYYDRFFSAKSEEETPYYRTFEKAGSVMKFTEMYNDTVIAKGYVNAGKYTGIANDLAEFVRQDGSPQKFKSAFETMRCVVDYSWRGKPFSKMVSHSGKVFFAQLWSQDGEELLVNGTGKNIRTEGEGILHEYYNDSLLIESYEVRTVQQDTLYRTHDKMAEPYGGYESFMKDFSKILNYPALARIAGKQGVVYIQFVVDKQGKLTEFKPLTKEGFNLEKKAINKLAEMPNWKPGIFHGKPVKMKFVLPVKFRLI